MQIMNVQDLVPGSRFTAIFKGDPGTGKSTAAGSFPNVFFIDIDQRMMPLRTQPMFRNRTDIYFASCNKYGDVCEVLNSLLSICPYQTIVLSSLTSLVRLIFKQAIILRGGGKGSMKKAGIEVNTVEDYSAESAGIIQILDALRYELKCNFILEAHLISESGYGKTGSTNLPRRLMTGARPIASEIPAYFDEVYHFDVIPSMESNKGPNRIFYTSHSGGDWAKSALQLPTVLDFTDRSAYDLIQEELKKNGNTITL